jgi:hypothetical protein
MLVSTGLCLYHLVYSAMMALIKYWNTTSTRWCSGSSLPTHLPSVIHTSIDDNDETRFQWVDRSGEHFLCFLRLLCHCPEWPQRQTRSSLAGMLWLLETMPHRTNRQIPWHHCSCTQAETPRHVLHSNRIRNSLSNQIPQIPTMQAHVLTVINGLLTTNTLSKHVARLVAKIGDKSLEVLHCLYGLSWYLFRQVNRSHWEARIALHFIYQLLHAPIMQVTGLKKIMTQRLHERIAYKLLTTCVEWQNYRTKSLSVSVPASRSVLDSRTTQRP